MPAYFNNFRSSESITWYEPTCICPQEVVGWLQVYFALVVLLRLSHIGQEPSVWGARHGRGDRGRLLGGQGTPCPLLGEVVTPGLQTQGPSQEKEQDPQARGRVLHSGDPRCLL